MTKKRVKMIHGAASGVLESVAEYDGEGRLLAVTYGPSGANSNSLAWFIGLQLAGLWRGPYVAPPSSTGRGVSPLRP